ncbi:MAG: prephenate dehydrogenase [Brevinematales bacterium]|jgi:prephenate dehydrogenase
MNGKTFGIYGLGLIGGSLAMAIKSFIPGSKVIGFGRNIEKLDSAKKLGIIDKAAAEDSEITAELDYFIIGTPIEMVADVFAKYMKSLNDNVIVMDVGSVKRPVINEINRINSRGLRFVSTHPMVGGEKSGFEFARADLFDKKIVGVIGEGPEEELDEVREFWRILGAQIVLVSADFHDEIVASTSHAPHLIASALSRCLEKDGWADVRFFGLYGRGLLDTTRISQGNPDMWAGITIMNSDNIERSLIDFSREIDTLIHIIRNKKRKELAEYLEKSKEFREKL